MGLQHHDVVMPRACGGAAIPAHHTTLADRRDAATGPRRKRSTIRLATIEFRGMQGNAGTRAYEAVGSRFRDTGAGPPDRTAVSNRGERQGCRRLNSGNACGREACVRATPTEEGRAGELGLGSSGRSCSVRSSSTLRFSMSSLCRTHTAMPLLAFGELEDSLRELQCTSNGSRLVRRFVQRPDQQLAHAHDGRGAALTALGLVVRKPGYVCHAVLQHMHGLHDPTGRVPDASIVELLRVSDPVRDAQEVELQSPRTTNGRAGATVLGREFTAASTENVGARAAVAVPQKSRSLVE